MASKDGKVGVGIIGASGYTGAELVRLLHGHPRAGIAVLAAGRRAGQPLGAVFPHLAGLGLPDLVALDAVDWDALDAVFCCLPHGGAAQELVAGLPHRLKVVDLSADFRLADPDVYARWYGRAHRSPELQREAVYGLTELARAEVAAARLVANPGCYPTGALLALLPLLEDGAIDADDIVIDAKSGVTGAGRGAREELLFGEVGEGMHAYGIANHFHAPEIDQGLSAATNRPVVVSFTPHLAPMNRGILATIYVRLARGRDAAGLRETLAARYDGEPFVRVLPEGGAPATRHVRGSNLCHIAVFADRVEGRAIVLSAIDNLVKGAAGQAVQNMNLMCGLPETMGLDQTPLFP